MKLLFFFLSGFLAVFCLTWFFIVSFLYNFLFDKVISWD